MQYEKIKKGQEIKLEISDLAFGGQGISKINDLIVFVKNAIPGQTVLAKVIKSKKKYIEAYKLEVINKSINEVDPECEHFKFCGGCTIQQMKYEKQLFYKQKQVSEIFNKIGRINNPQVNSIIGCDKIYFYRNKMEYTFSDNPWFIDDESYDDIVVGLHVPKRFDKILNINQCHINHDMFNKILNIAKQVANDENMIAYNVVKHTGFLRYLVLRIGVHTNELMINIVSSRFNKKIIEKFKEQILKKIPNTTSIINTINAEKNNTAKGYTKTIYGQSFINEKIGNYTFKISPNSFFQTNSYQVKTLYDYIIKTANFKKNDIVYDLYCGTGTIGIYLAQRVKHVYGIEIIEDAIKDAKINAEINNINNIDFYCGDLKDILDSDSMNEIAKPTVVIVDPPRPGLHPNTVKNLVRLSPEKIIYISCNPSTPARDIRMFQEDKFKLIATQPVDMFPHTPHIECIATLRIS